MRNNSYQYKYSPSSLVFLLFRHAGAQ